MSEPEKATLVAAPATAPKKEKKKPENLVIPPPKPKLSKAERRALQEQQRAAKAGGPAAGGAGIKKSAVSPTTAAAATTATAPSSGNQQQEKVGQQQQTQQKSSSSSDKGVDPAAAQEEDEAGGGAGTEAKQCTSYFSHLTAYRDPQKTFLSGPVISPLEITTTTSILLLLQQKQQSSSSSSHVWLHPAVIELGRRYATGTILAPSGGETTARTAALVGGNARCRAMLECFQRVLHDFTVPSSSLIDNNEAATTTATLDLRHVVDQLLLKPAFQYWTTECRPHSVSMGNAFTFLKTAVNSLPRDVDLPTLKETLMDTMQAFVKERIDFADRAIADLAVEKLLLQNQQHHLHSRNRSCFYSRSRSSNINNDNDDDWEDEEEEVILTFGRSQVVSEILILAARQLQTTQNSSSGGPSRRRCRRRLRVVVVDSRPLLEGRTMLRILREHNIECTYILLNALSYVLQEQPKPSKVLLGASALMSDGSVLGRVGSACVAMAAHAHNIPVLFCSETYKISNRVQLESITHNELGNPNQLYSNNNNNNNSKNPQLLNFLYDLTPSAYVSGIVTELGIVPPTSIAVLLREMNPHSETQFKGDASSRW